MRRDRETTLKSKNLERFSVSKAQFLQARTTDQAQAVQASVRLGQQGPQGKDPPYTRQGRPGTATGAVQTLGGFDALLAVHFSGCLVPTRKFPYLNLSRFRTHFKGRPGYASCFDLQP